MNKKARGNNWPDGFVRISNKRLMTYLPYRFDSMAKAREGLARHGLIEFVHGVKNEQSPMYKMNWLTQAQFYPAESDNISHNIGGNIGGNHGLIYNKLNETERNEYDDDDDCYAGARELVEKAYYESYGEVATPSMIDCIVRRASAARMEDALTEHLIDRSARNAPQAPMGYINALIDECEDHWIRTLTEYVAYTYDKEHHAGSDKIKADALERKIKYQEEDELDC